MDRQFVTILCLVAIAMNAIPGCMLRKPGTPLREDLAHLRQLANQTQYDDVYRPDPPSPALQSGPPRLLTDLTPADFWPMTPEEAVQLAIGNSPVLRDLGGTVLRSPETIRTLQNPALQETDPRTGVPAALAFFDANLATRMFFEKNDRAVNNRIVGLGTQIFQQDLLNWEAELSKRSMTGGQYTFRKTWQYDANNSTDNFFPSAWGVLMDFEVRQPLLQGAGVGFNQVAGAEAAPGEINGVRIARLNTDISIAEYRIALRNLVSNVENAYWDLYYAYRDLEAKIAARDEALQTWREFEASVALGGAAVDAEAQAREQYFRFQEEVQNALSGRLLQGTEINNGSTGGTFRGTLGVLVAERRLRLAMGLPINDGRVIRPAYDPKMVKVVFDWDEVLGEALTRRAELERQRTEIRRTRLELMANRNFLLPRLDAFGRYRFRGLGQELIDSPNSTPIMVGPDTIDPSFDNAYQNLTTGDFQEWQLGFEFTLPVGFRRAHAAVRHAQLRLARAQAILEEQERHVVYGLSNAYAEVVRAFEVMQTAYNRRIAAKENYETLDARLRLEPESDRQANANLLLDAQRRLADSESRFYLAQVDYMLAVKNVHFEKGSLLDYNEVYVVGDERQLPPEDAASLRKWQRGRPFDYLLTRPRRSGPRSEPTQDADQPAENVVETTEDGNVIPRDGWPMIRLPQLALPEVQLPSLDNLAAPTGPTSPAQVLPPSAPGTGLGVSPTTSSGVPTPVARRSPKPAEPETAESEMDEGGNAELQAAVERAAAAADAGTEESARTGPRRPALRLPFRSTHAEPARDDESTGAAPDQRETPAGGPRHGGVRVDVADASADVPKPSGASRVTTAPSRPRRAPDYRFPAMPSARNDARKGGGTSGERQTNGEREVAGNPPVAKNSGVAAGSQSAAPAGPSPNGFLRELVRNGASTDPAANPATDAVPAAGSAGSHLPVEERAATIRPVEPPRFVERAREDSRGSTASATPSPTTPRGAWRPLPTGEQPSQLQPAQANSAAVARHPAPQRRTEPVATARFVPPVSEQGMERRPIPVERPSQLRSARPATVAAPPNRPAMNASEQTVNAHEQRLPGMQPPAGSPDGSSLGSFISATGDVPPPGKPLQDEADQPPLLRMLFGTERDQQEAKTVRASAQSKFQTPTPEPRRKTPAPQNAPLFRLPSVERTPPIGNLQGRAPVPPGVRPMPSGDGFSPATVR